VEVAPPFAIDGRPVRSSDIRAAIASGDLDQARVLLGRRVAVVGSAAASRAGASRVTFDLPVALPPDGNHPVSVAAPGRRAVRGTAEVSAGALLVDVPVQGRVRVTFAS